MVSNAGGVAEFSGAAVAAARGEFESVSAAAAGEQLPLIGNDDGEEMPDLSDDERYHGLPDAGEVMEIMAGEGLALQEAVAEHRRRKGAGGRKKGALNKRSESFKLYMLQYGPHPGITMQRIQARPLEQLAAELGCDKKTAIQLQIRCASEMLPYFESKMPVAVDIRAKGDLTLEIGDFMGLGLPVIDAAGQELDLDFVSDEESDGNQGLSDDDKAGLQ